MKEFAALSVRIAGLALIVITLARIPAYAMSYQAYPGNGIITYLIVAIIPIVGGFLLMRFPRTIGGRIIDAVPENFTVARPYETLRIGMILIGVTLGFFVISDLVYHASMAAFIHALPEYELGLATYDWPSVIATLVEFAVVLALIFRPSRLIAMMRVGIRED